MIYSLKVSEGKNATGPDWSTSSCPVDFPRSPTRSGQTECTLVRHSNLKQPVWIEEDINISPLDLRDQCNIAALNSLVSAVIYANGQYWSSVLITRYLQPWASCPNMDTRLASNLGNITSKCEIILIISFAGARTGGDCWALGSQSYIKEPSDVYLAPGGLSHPGHPG